MAKRKLHPMPHDFNLPATERIFVSPYVLAKCCRHDCLALPWLRDRKRPCLTAFIAASAHAPAPA